MFYVWFGLFLDIIIKMNGWCFLWVGLFGSWLRELVKWLILELFMGKEFVDWDVGNIEIVNFVRKKVMGV